MQKRDDHIYLDIIFFYSIANSHLNSYSKISYLHNKKIIFKTLLLDR